MNLPAAVGGASQHPILPPSGEQFTIQRGSHEAVITEIGATLRSFTVEGVDVVDGFGLDEMSSAPTRWNRAVCASPRRRATRWSAVERASPSSR